MDSVFYENRIKNFPNGPIRYVNLAGIVPEIMEERHVRLILPVEEIHLNHVGIVYAGSMFVIAEIAGANLFVCTYGQDEFVPILKGMEIKYNKPTKKDLVIDLFLTEEEAVEKIAKARERGRGDYFLDVPIKDVDGNEVALATFNYYAIQPGSM
jgi:acyl-coenzyme A thioesterase PaaI-like protein